MQMMYEIKGLTKCAKTRGLHFHITSASPFSLRTHSHGKIWHLLPACREFNFQILPNTKEPAKANVPCTEMLGRWKDRGRPPPAARLGSETDAGPSEVWRGKRPRNPSCTKNGCSITAAGKGAARAKDRLPSLPKPLRARRAHVARERPPSSRSWGSAKSPSWDISQTAKA